VIVILKNVGLDSTDERREDEKERGEQMMMSAGRVRRARRNLQFWGSYHIYTREEGEEKFPVGSMFVKK